MRHIRVVIIFFGLALSNAAVAQLMDDSQVNQNNNVDAPGGTIAKSLQDQIGTGRGDSGTPGSSIYLINRDPARSVRRGRQLFQRKFTAAEGQGPRVNFTSTGDVTETRILGAGLADSCAACHGRPRGSAGFGGNVATRPDSRDSPQLFGLGIVEQLADEMTGELRTIRAEAIADATGGGTCNASPGDPAAWLVDTFYDVGDQVSFDGLGFQAVQAHTSQADWQPPNTPSLWNRVSPEGVCPWEVQVPYAVGDRVTFEDQLYEALQAHTSQSDWDPASTPSLWEETTGGGSPVTRQLVAKGIDFGSITANPDGSVDTANVDGVDDNLRIKPFFHQGGTISMREFINGAFKGEMGMETPDPVLCAATDPNAPQTVVSPAGFVFNPSLDEFERPPVCSASADGDGDGVTNEIDPALVDHMEFYLLNYFKPGQYQVTQRAQEGLQLMNQIGCTGCHTQDLTIDSDRRVADVETVFDPAQGIFNDLFATASTRFEVIDDGNEFPLLQPEGNPFVVENFFSDLKRHDLGPAFHERDYDGSRVTEFVTEPLWGVGSTAPYGHDGRSINLDQVIRRHGGEADSAKQAYVNLSADDRRKVREFLETLVLFPPDDTASNLNPGDPNGDPQVPANHGSINLGALFQIPGEGPE